MHPPKLIDSQTVYNNYMEVKCDTLEFEGRHQHAYYSIHLPKDAVIVLASDLENNWLVLKEYRHPTGEILWGLPGGLIDGNEDFLESAQRELLEETGCEAKEWAYMGSAYPYAGISSQKTYFYRAWGTTQKSTPKLDLSESLTAQFLTPKELSVKVQIEPVDALLMSALHFNSLLS
jgi:ADP-ribose pyrophosphatase